MLTNPYAPPEAVDQPATERQTGGSSDARETSLAFPIWWPIAFAINLTLPLLFAWSMTTPDSRIGLFPAIGLLLASGWLLQRRFPAVGKPLLIGSIVVGVTQVFPIPHIIAGVFGMEVTQWFFADALNAEQDGFSRLNHPLPVFVCTLLTGGCLAGVAMLIGGTLCGIHAGIRRHRHRGLHIGTSVRADATEME